MSNKSQLFHFGQKTKIATYLLAGLSIFTIASSVLWFTIAYFTTRNLEGDPAQAGGLFFGLILALIIMPLWILTFIADIVFLSFLIKKYNLSKARKLLAKCLLGLSIFTLISPVLFVILATIFGK